MVRKTLRSLPERFYPKVTAVKECQDLDTIKIEELIGSFQTFELKLRPSNKKKDIATKVEESPNTDKDSYEEFVKVVRRFKKFFKKNTRDYKKQQLR